MRLSYNYYVKLFSHIILSNHTGIFSDNRYIPLENYQQIPDQLENITQSLDDSDDGSHRDSSHYTIPNMTYAGNSNYEKDWTSSKH